MKIYLFNTQIGDGNVNTIEQRGEDTKELLELIRKIEKEVCALKVIAQVYKNKPENEDVFLPLSFEQLN